MIPTHNRPELLREALTSVLGQQAAIRHIAEIIVVADDDSTRTVDVVDEFARVDPRVRLVKTSGGQRGASSSRNIGALSVDAEYVAFLDDDDIWLPNYLDVVVERLDAGRALALSSRTFADNVPLEDRLVNDRSLSRFDAFTKGSPVTGSTLVISRRAFEAVGGYDTSLPVLNDTDFFVRALASGVVFSAVQEPVVGVRQHEGPQLTDSGRRRAEGMKVFYRKHAALMTLAERRGYRYRMYGMYRLGSTAVPTKFLFGLRQLVNLTPRSLTSRLRSRSRDNNAGGT